MGSGVDDFKCAKCGYYTGSPDEARNHHNPITGHIMQYYSISKQKWENAFMD